MVARWRREVFILVLQRRVDELQSEQSKAAEVQFRAEAAQKQHTKFKEVEGIAQALCEAVRAHSLKTFSQFDLLSKSASRWVIFQPEHA